MSEEMLTLKQLRKWDACEDALKWLCNAVGHNHADSGGSLGTFSDGSHEHADITEFIRHNTGAHWPLRDVVVALRQRSGNAGPGPLIIFESPWLNWLRNHDPRVAAIEAELDGAAGEQDKEVFEPKDLEQKDEVVVDVDTTLWYSGGHTASMHGDDPCRFRVIGICEGTGDTALSSITGRGQLYTTNDLRGHITEVTRGGVVIFPRPEPKFSVDQRIRCFGKEFVIASRRFYDSADGDVGPGWVYEFTLNEDRTGAHESNIKPVPPEPEWVPKVGEFFSVSGVTCLAVPHSAYKAREPRAFPITAFRFDTSNFDAFCAGTLKPYEPPVDAVARVLADTFGGEVLSVTRQRAAHLCEAVEIIILKEPKDEHD